VVIAFELMGDRFDARACGRAARGAISSVFDVLAGEIPQSAKRQEVTAKEIQSMKRYWLSRYLLSGLTILLFIAITAPISVRAQSADALRDLVHIGDNYQFMSNIVYRTASNWDAKLDVYEPRGLKAPNPTIMFFHGGGWTNGTKEASTFSLLPYLQMGWTVVTWNIE
jgi:hypothetical protein